MRGNLDIYNSRFLLRAGPQQDVPSLIHAYLPNKERNDTAKGSSHRVREIGSERIHNFVHGMLRFKGQEKREENLERETQRIYEKTIHDFSDAVMDLQQPMKS